MFLRTAPPFCEAFSYNNFWLSLCGLCDNLLTLLFIKIRSTSDVTVKKAWEKAEVMRKTMLRDW